MHPILFHFGGINIYSYGVLVATGVLFGLWYARKQAPRAGSGSRQNLEPGHLHGSGRAYRWQKSGWF